MPIQSMFLLELMILACCCVKMCDSTLYQSQNIIQAEYTAHPRTAILVNTPNYDLPEHYSSFSDSISVDEPVDYFLNDSVIFAYAFTNKDKLGTITVIFKEFNLDPGSLLYIYDGRNVSALGSLWTYNTDVPVYSSTGPQVLMIFKTGKLNITDRNVGFAAEVNFLAQGTTWKSKPGTEFCTPFVHTDNYASFTEIRYNSTTPGLPVQCTYTSHILHQQNMFIASSAGASGSIFELRDYPSLKLGRKLTPYKINNVTTVLNESMTMYSYNLSSAVYGFYLELQPTFTEPDQRVFVVSALNDAFAEKVVELIIFAQQPDLGNTYCS